MARYGRQRKESNIRLLLGRGTARRRTRESRVVRMAKKRDADKAAGLKIAKKKKREEISYE